MEPPGPDVHHPGEDAPAVGPLRLAAAAGAVTLALAGHGHLLVLGLLVALVLASRAGALAAILATVATLVRWGSPSLTAVAGGQAVLGPAIVVGSTAAAASALLAAAAIVVATPRAGRPALDEAVAPFVVGATAAALAAGPTLVDAPLVRGVGIVVATVAALVAARLPHPRAGAVVLGAGAVVCAAIG